MKHKRIGIMLVLLSVCSLGCQTLLYELQPHRLRRINRHPPPSLDPEFSAIKPHQLRGQPLDSYAAKAAEKAEPQAM